MCKIGTAKQFRQQFFSIQLCFVQLFMPLCVYFYVFFFHPSSVLVHWNTQDFQCTPENVNSKSALFYHYQNRNKRSLVGHATTCFVEAKQNKKYTGSGTDLRHFASRHEFNGLNIINILVSKYS